MTSTTNYYQLVASLPHLPPTFEVSRVPITRIQLEQRLKMLGDDDRIVVEQYQRFLVWDRQHPERTDEEFQSEYDRLMRTIKNPLVREMVNHRMDVRTITCGLRRRRLGLSPPTGVGQYVDVIRNKWRDADFGLATKLPWISALREALEAKRTLAVERQLLLATWNRWVKLSDAYHFSFETILLYLARWEIVDRWTRLDETLGQQKFDQLLREVLDGHASFNA